MNPMTVTEYEYQDVHSVYDAVKNRAQYGMTVYYLICHPSVAGALIDSMIPVSNPPPVELDLLATPWGEVRVKTSPDCPVNVFQLHSLPRTSRVWP